MSELYIYYTKLQQNLILLAFGVSGVNGWVPGQVFYF